ncbi:hypothetical protein [Actinomadura madurae]|uniref:hypothetical protein n=1 Tax=Actinomadura madurae TaxID=1993 RepID=UPI0020D25D19|nr:hypothetical protein [Actinomadura madurae]MCP9947187.1 hypothetical protein [Actinomadura madurae]MCP9963952.1 hypothetical protein [Actinomadura madurae]MCQ0012081.1 hypothetical protein [Actinomadura madurae]MCQ0012619.1 hypothetical protein [Actinomadura madurae]
MGEVTITAEMVMEVTAIKRSAAEGIAVYATHRFAGLLPADARRETNVSMGTGGRNEKVIRLLCDRYDLPAPPQPKHLDSPDFVGASRRTAHRQHIQRGVVNPHCALCGTGATP